MNIQFSADIADTSIEGPDLTETIEIKCDEVNR